MKSPTLTQYLSELFKLFWGWIVISFFGFLVFLPLKAFAINQYPIEIIEITDGDTVAAEIEVWPKWKHTTLVRIRGINTAESQKGQATVVCKESGFSGDGLDDCRECEMLAGERAKARLNELVKGQCYIENPNPSEAKYADRISADLFCNSVNVGQVLITELLAKPYQGEKRNAWCD
jgi:endonuclease YncB( thermonuclease family)